MKAMVLETCGPVHDRSLVLKEVPDPRPGPGEVVLEISACGVCRTDLHTVEGDLELPRLPLIPGHQIVGRVVESGPDTKGRFREGERVGLPWLHKTCGKCAFCREGKENLCEGAIFTGFHRDGGYAEKVKAPEDFLYRMPEGLSDLQAAPLLCAGIIGHRALMISGIQPGQRLGIYGFGASAHVALQVAVHRGCEVYVVSRTPSHRELAKRLGASWVGGPEEKPPELLHSSIVFAPAGPVALQAMEHLRPGGTCALAGVTMTPIPEMDYEKHLFHEKVLRSVTAATREDGESHLAEAAEAGVKTEIQVFPLEEANKALMLLKESRIDGAAVLRIRPDAG